jgi:hypothetical protein
MAGPQSNAPLRADAGAPSSGVIHVRTRLTADFTVIANALAQRRGSAVTVGVAAYILSLPDGASVSIAALCKHFTEGEILISRALKELEEAGYLERRRERGPGGLIRTRTYFYDVPVRVLPTPPPPTPPRPRRPAAAPAQTPTPTPTWVRPPAPEPVRSALTTPETGAAPTPKPLLVPASPPSLAEADPQAVVILASLRIVDPRLILSAREVAQLAPTVTRWLAAGVGAAQLTDLLTTRLPDHIQSRPARLLAFRLSKPPLPAPDPVAAPAVLPWQTCDGGCERAFRGAEPGRCRDCPPDNDMTTAGPVITRDDHLRAAC